jgi:mono/diheme cytochrome c family protein
MGRSLLMLAALALYGGTAWSADYVAMSGKDLYQRFCASCHGAEGHGDGSVAASFKVEVPDLTLIAHRAGNVYPRDRVIRIIDGRYILGAHGSRPMPVWGEELGRLEIGNPDAERATRVVIDRLADYVGQLQKQTPP